MGAHADSASTWIWAHGMTSALWVDMGAWDDCALWVDMGAWMTVRHKQKEKAALRRLVVLFVC